MLSTNHFTMVSLVLWLVPEITGKTGMKYVFFIDSSMFSVTLEFLCHWVGRDQNVEISQFRLQHISRLKSSWTFSGRNI